MQADKSTPSLLKMIRRVLITSAGFWVLCLAIPFTIAWELDSEIHDFDYGLYEDALRRFIDDVGRVNYFELKKDRSKLDLFTDSLERLSLSEFEKWNRSEQLAFWINAYNALTLKAVVDHYPIRAGFFKSLVYPKNSIRQIPGVWDKLSFPIQGQQVTLNDIEHEIIRKEFREPRIHLALVCASRGCPPLRPEAYRGEKLEAQFEDQAQRFLSDPEKLRIDRANKRVYLSSIFDWFKEDFVEIRGSSQSLSSAKNNVSAVIGFISSYVSEADAKYLIEGAYETKFLEYDWALNEQ